MSQSAMNLTCRIDTIQMGQSNVHDNDVWLQGYGLGDRLDATGRLAYDLELGTFAEEFAQTGPCYSVIIGDQNTKRLRCATGRVMA
jgi:hypothetical protein